MGELQETIKDKVASYHEDMIEYWKDLVNYQAGSKEAELITALLQKVADRFTKEGFTATMLDTSCAIPMLRATLGDDRQGKPILFCGHVDTVFPSGSYPDQPFRIEDGKVYGPGCADMKGGVVMLLYVIKILTDLGRCHLHSGTQFVGRDPLDPLLHQFAQISVISWQSSYNSR